MIAHIFDIVAPVFLLIAAGAAAVKLGWSSDQTIDGLMSFALKFAAPSLLYLSVSRMDIGQSFEWGLMASFYLAVTVSFLLAYLVCRMVFSLTPGEAVAVGFGALFSNALLLGVPISERAYGVDSLSTNFALLSVHAPFCYLLGISAMELVRTDKQSVGKTIRDILVAMFRNPLMIGIGLGFVVNITQVILPTPLMAVIEMLAAVTLPIALFAIGGVLTRYSLGPSLGVATSIGLLSLLVHPALVWLLGTHVFSVDVTVLRNAVLMAAMAPGINAFVFATMYKRKTEVAASVVLLGTIASVLTASGWIWFLG